jgi:hypothetical protein
MSILMFPNFLKGWTGYHAFVSTTLQNFGPLGFDIYGGRVQQRLHAYFSDWTILNVAGYTPSSAEQPSCIPLHCEWIMGSAHQKFELCPSEFCSHPSTIQCFPPKTWELGQQIQPLPSGNSGMSISQIQFQIFKTAL